ncbi:hypothetical protein GCM10010466_18530 [Planomonospora alba]|uniref:Uncharacterized protein n=1 Tax=Planomonospora alba TaxID=161354 RepID=A0ABP6MYD5_9ACTN
MTGPPPPRGPPGAPHAAPRPPGAPLPAGRRAGCTTRSIAAAISPPPTSTLQVSGSPYTAAARAVTQRGCDDRITAAGTGGTWAWPKERARKPSAQATTDRWPRTAQSPGVAGGVSPSGTASTPVITAITPSWITATA